VGRRAYPSWSFDLFHAVYVLEIPYLLILMWMLNRWAGASFDMFRPSLKATPEQAAGLRDSILHSPAGSTLAASILALAVILILIVGAFGFGAFLGPDPAASLQAAATPLSVGAVVLLGAVRWFFYGGIGYHLYHQLSTISAIYANWTKINLFDTRPLNAFSRQTARTALGVIVIPYAWFTSAAGMSDSSFSLIISLVFALLAVLIFILPLRGVHQLLEQEKAREMGKLAGRLEVLRDELDDLTERGDYSEVGGIDKAIGAYSRLRQDLESVATWPWQPGAFRSFLGTLSIPVLVWVLQRVLDRFLAL
jgi:hypothetical protein